MIFTPGEGLRILMYHKVSPDQTDDLTITTDNLDMQLAWITEKRYTPVSFLDLKEWIETGKTLPDRPVILTFDDAYESFYTYAWPLLNQYHMKATVFVPVAYIGKTNIWDQGTDTLLSVDQLKQLNYHGNIETGIHSFLHRSYAELAIEDMKEDLESCFRTMEFHSIPTIRVLAYPYGGYPKDDPGLKQEMKELFQTSQLWFAVRIGNRVNPLPVRDRYELKRIDIKGTDSFLTFKIKLALGRKNPFA